MELYEFFWEMPKGGILHLHSEYAVAPEFWLTILTSASELARNQYFVKVSDACHDAGAKQNTVLFATVQRATLTNLTDCDKRNYKPLIALDAEQRSAWLSSLRLDRKGEGRREFFDGIVPRLDELWQDPDLMLEVIPEIMKQAAAEHVSYLELQFDPTSLHDVAGRPVLLAEFLKRLLLRLHKADVQNTRVVVRFQMAAYRYASDPSKEISNAFQFVDRHRDLWVGVNLLGEEGRPNGSIARFRPALQEMLSRYDVPISLHAGELDSPGPQVREALAAGASRIGHALNLIDDPDTMLLMRHSDVAIETSLVSNKLLQYTPDLSRHPFPVYLRFGIPVCLNTDDPGAWDGSLTDEFFLAATLYNLSWDEILTVVHNSIQYSFVDRSTKARLLSQLDRDFLSFEQRLSSPNWSANLKQRPHLCGFAKRYLR